MILSAAAARVMNSNNNHFEVPDSGCKRNKLTKERLCGGEYLNDQILMHGRETTTIFKFSARNFKTYYKMLAF